MKVGDLSETPPGVAASLLSGTPHQQRVWEPTVFMGIERSDGARTTFKVEPWWAFRFRQQNYSVQVSDMKSYLHNFNVIHAKS